MAREVTVPSLYQHHRAWALDLAAEHEDTDEDRLTALVVLWQSCREYEGGGFKDFARPRILEALKRTAVEA